MNAETLIGYRKIMALAAGIIGSLVLMKTGNVETSKGLEQTIIDISPMFISGIYMIINTIKSIQEKKVSVLASSMSGAAPVPMVLPSSDGQPISETIASPIILEVAPVIWDVQAFDDQVKKKTIITYGVLNESTELYQAMNSGVEAKCDYIEHAVAYWDYLVMKADARFNSIWGYSFREATEKVNEPGCPTHPTTCGNFSNLKHKALALGESYYTSYLDYERIRQKAADIILLSIKVSKGFNWKNALPISHQTLYWLGEDSTQLLKLCS